MSARLGERIASYLQTPGALRGISRVMREVAPVAKIGNAVFVFKHPDVVELLSSDADFGVTPGYAAKMMRTSGAFFLGMEDGERYQRESSFARGGFRPGDDERIRRLIREAAQELIDAKQTAGRMDFVTDFADQIPYVLLRDYFGVAGPNRHTLHRWMSSLFWELFLNFADDTAVSKRADESAREMRPYLQTLAAQIRDHGGNDTFLSRLVALQQRDHVVDELGVVRNIGGIIIGAMSTQAKAMTLALQELLNRPDVLDKAQEAARADDDEAVSGYVFEALRFNPHNPLVVRYAMRPAVVAPNTPHALHVKTGTQIFAMTISASFDPKGFRDPASFDPTRPYGEYLHYGYGLHRCFGANLVKVVLTAAMKEILKLERLQSVSAPSRAVAYDGPFPSSMKLTFEPRAALGAVPLAKPASRVAAAAAAFADAPIWSGFRT